MTALAYCVIITVELGIETWKTCFSTCSYLKFQVKTKQNVIWVGREREIKIVCWIKFFRKKYEWSFSNSYDVVKVISTSAQVITYQTCKFGSIYVDYAFPTYERSLLKHFWLNTPSIQYIFWICCHQGLLKMVLHLFC